MRRQDLIPSTAVVRSYPAVERDCWVWLWMGDPALADPALILAALGHHHPGWFMQTGQLAYEANYELINDNLLGLTHLSYVHEKPLGRNSMSWGESRPKVTPIERGLRIARGVVNNPAPAYLGLSPEARIDMWASYDHLVPGVFLLATQSHRPGTAAACRMEAPSAEPMWCVLTSQAVTPISERQTVYYYSGGLSSNYATEEQSKQQIAVFEKAFAEDKAMIEAQQRILDRTRGRRMMILATDGALNKFRRLMAELIEAEQASLPKPAERRFA